MWVVELNVQALKDYLCVRETDRRWEVKTAVLAIATWDAKWLEYKNLNLNRFLPTVKTLVSTLARTRF